MPKVLRLRTLEERGWQRSRKGNLWQRFGDDTTVTVFRAWEDNYRVCIYTDQPVFLSSYGSEREAVAAAMEWLEERGMG